MKEAVLSKNGSGLRVVKQGQFGRLADIAMMPLMYWLQGNCCESPQETHFWNNQKFTIEESQHLDTSRMLTVSGDSLASNRRWIGFIPLFHMPRFGGWKKFVVLEPKEPTTHEWFIGWITGDSCGVSIIPLVSPVRVLRGPSECQFFGLLQDGRQIELKSIGVGRIGQVSIYGHLPLR